MKHLLKTSIITAVACGIFAAALPEVLFAQFYNGPGIVGGLSEAQQIGGVSNKSLREVILDMLLTILIFMGLAAVVVIVIAGASLILSVGEDSARDKARKTVTYALGGLLLVAVSSGIVLVIMNSSGTTDLFGPLPELGNAGGSDIRITVLSILRGVLGFMALAAVVVIVAAGVYLVLSLGEEQAKDRAKKIILYAIIGLFVIMFASAMVGFVEDIIQNTNDGGGGPIRAF